MMMSFSSTFILLCLLHMNFHVSSSSESSYLHLLQPDLKFTVGRGNAANGFSRLWIKPISTSELCFPWLLDVKSKAEPGLSIYLRNTEVTLKENTIMFASTSASLSRGREVTAHFSTSAIKGNITSYMLPFIPSMLYFQQTLENWCFLCHRTSGWMNLHCLVEITLHRCCWSTALALGLYLVSAGAPGSLKLCTWPFTEVYQNTVVLLVVLTGRVGVKSCSVWDSKGITSHYSSSWNCQSFFRHFVYR